MLFQNSRKLRLIKKVLYYLLRRPYNIPLGCISTGTGENLEIGANVSFGGNVFLFGTATIAIGDHTMVAYGVIIHTSTHDYKIHPMNTSRIDKPVKIGKHVWIGTSAIILPGIIIEDYAVIGAGSVVTAHVPKGAIVVGNPARIIKYRETSSYKDDAAPAKGHEIIKDGFLDKSKHCKPL